jgi:hypothetical protein
MNITSGIQPATLDQYSVRTGDTVTTSTMKKAMDIQAQQAAQLIESARESAPAPQGGPSHLGQRIDVTA